MNTQATGLIPFVPAGPDFTLALRFFAALGFVSVWADAQLALLRFGGARFFLQNIDAPQWATQQMITLEVDDLEGYWRELCLLGLAQAFPGVKLKEPSDYPWGREVNIIDPAGVCWHVRQTRA